MVNCHYFRLKSVPWCVIDQTPWFGWWAGAKQATSHYLNRLDMSTACRRVKSSQSLSGTWSHKDHTYGLEWSSHISFIPNLSAFPFPKSGYFKLWPWSFKVRVMGVVKTQGHIIGQYLCDLLPVRFTSDQQFLRHNYFEMWLWKIQGQGHVWGQRSMLHRSPSIQLMHFFLIAEIWSVECLTMKKS